MAVKLKPNKRVQSLDFRYDEGFRGRTDSDLATTITTKNGGFSGVSLIALARERESGSMKYSEESLKRIKNNVVDKNEQVPTITANAMQSMNHQNCSLVENDLIIRKLTDKEVARLMGFEDKDYEAMREIGMNKSAIYHQCGDSLVPNIVAMILGCILPCGELGAKTIVETYTDNIVEKNCIKGTHTHTIEVKNNTEKGYLVANQGDGIDISGRMETHRGTVQKGSCQTLTCMGGNDVGVVVSKK